MRRITKFAAGGGIALALALGLGACSFGGTTASSALQRETAAQAADSNQLTIAQPVPKFKYSQIRADEIAIQEAQAGTTQTTSFFFNLGVTKPIMSCPSIGFPIASDTELTNPEQAVWNNGGNSPAGATVDQMDPNGVYTGDSTGTYVECVAPDGTTYFQYWEGYVDTVTGPAVWDNATSEVQLTGPSSVQIPAGK